MDELRLAYRRLRKHPGGSIASVLTLACAIAAVSATYTLLSALLLTPIRVSDPDRLVVVGQRIQRGPDAGQLYVRHIYTTFTHVRDASVFERVAALGISGVRAVVDVNGVRIPVTVNHPTYDFFDTVGIRISRGRTFQSADDQRGAPLTMIVSERFWRRTLASDPEVIGRVVRINDKPATVVGVAPAGFRGIDLSAPADVYMPLHTVGEIATVTRNFFADATMNDHFSPSAWVVIVGRVRAGATPEQVTSALASVPPGARRQVAQNFGVIPIEAAALPARTRSATIEFTKLLGATVALLLLIGAVTVGMLLLVRTEARADEFAMCVALGASRQRLAAGVAIEGALLSVMGVFIAIPLSIWLLNAVRAFQLPGGIDLERLAVTIDVRAFAAAAAAALAATLVITAVAATAGFRARIADALRSRAGATPRVSRRRTRALLVATQVAVALVLVAGSALFVRSTIAALQLNPGFDASRVLRASLRLPGAYDPARAQAFFDSLRQRLDGHAGIDVVAVSALGDGMSAGGMLTIDGEAREMPSPVPFASVDERFFEAMSMRAIEGRGFGQGDAENAPPIGVVSESFGRFIGRGRSPIGHKIRMPFWRPPVPPTEVEIVGVVPDVVTSISDLQPFILYRPIAQAPAGTVCTIVIRLSRGAPVSVARREIAATIHQLDPSVTPPLLPTIDEELMRQMAPQRFGAVVMGSLGTIAILLTILGTYVLAESMTIMRMRELGIRAALGATRRQLGGLVLAETGRLVGGGVAAGLFLAWMGASTIRSFLFHVAPLDPVTLSTVSGMILILGFAVSARPALRAASVDLSRVLKDE